jgi:hypothetical protein
MVEVVGVGRRRKTRSHHGEGGDGNVVSAISGLGAPSALCRGDDLGVGLAI